MEVSARELALRVVRDVFASTPQAQRGTQESFDYHLRKTDLDARDRAFATVLAFGSVKMRRTLDWYLRPYIADRGKALPPAIAEILRLAIYEIVFTSGAAH